jgi:hypothetical protein
MTDDPRICAVVSCGEQKQDLEDGETVPARELYTSSVHSCKDKYGRHSHGYFIASAEFGLVSPETELPEYDTNLEDLPPHEQRRWAQDVLTDLIDHVRDRGFDAIVLIGGETYVEACLNEARHISIPVPIFTPWQSLESITGVGKGMSWCTTEDHWPINLSSPDKEILGPARSTDTDYGLDRWK